MKAFQSCVFDICKDFPIGRVVHIPVGNGLADARSSQGILNTTKGDIVESTGYIKEYCKSTLLSIYSTLNLIHQGWYSWLCRFSSLEAMLCPQHIPLFWFQVPLYKLFKTLEEETRQGDGPEGLCSVIVILTLLRYKDYIHLAPSFGNVWLL